MKIPVLLHDLFSGRYSGEEGARREKPMNIKKKSRSNVER